MFSISRFFCCEKWRPEEFHHLLITSNVYDKEQIMVIGHYNLEGKNMKRWLSGVLIVVMILSLSACGKAEEEKIPTAKEQLSELETELFEAIVKMTTDSFYEPAAARVLKVGDYKNNTKWGVDDYLYGPDLVVVQMQGTNRLGGTRSIFLLLCIKNGENADKERIARLEVGAGFWQCDKEDLLRYKGTVGDNVELYDDYEIKEDASDLFDIGKINKALKEYWEEKGF